MAHFLTLFLLLFLFFLPLTPERLHCVAINTGGREKRTGRGLPHWPLAARRWRPMASGRSLRVVLGRNELAVPGRPRRRLDDPLSRWVRGSHNTLGLFPEGSTNHTVHRNSTAKSPGFKPKLHYILAETLGKLLNFSMPQFPICKMGTMMIILGSTYFLG